MPVPKFFAPDYDEAVTSEVETHLDDIDVVLTEANVKIIFYAKIINRVFIQCCENLKKITGDFLAIFLHTLWNVCVCVCGVRVFYFAE